LAAVLSTHAQDDGRSLGPDSVAQAAVQERQRRQEIDALQAIARELRTLNDRVLDLVREMRDLRQEMERKH
jgi:molecular chaperone GrpE (heat shock protein)